MSKTPSQPSGAKERIDAIIAAQRAVLPAKRAENRAAMGPLSTFLNDLVALGMHRRGIDYCSIGAPVNVTYGKSNARPDDVGVIASPSQKLEGRGDGR